MKKVIISIIAFVSIFVFTSVAMGNQWKLKSAYVTDTVKVKVFGQTVETDVIAAQKEGENSHRYYVSAADLAMYLGYYTEWDSKTKTVSIGSFPSYDGPLDDEKLESVRKAIDDHKSYMFGNMSARQIDSLYKELAYLNKASGGDPLFYMLLGIEDYRVYLSGGKSSFGSYWDSLSE